MTVTKGILWALTILGAGLVSQGLITGEQLTSIQSVVGMALGGGGITAIGIIGILNAIPKQIVSSAFDKATEKYGEDKVLSFLDNIDAINTAVATLTYKVDQVISVQETQEAQRKKLLG